MSQNTTTFSLAPQASSKRTGFDILWSCLFTIFACTWTVQHLNVPPQREDESTPGWRGDFKRWWRNFRTSMTWIIITILTSEVLITLNSGQLFCALETLKKSKAFAAEDDVPWSLTHSLFANMGDLVAREHSPERPHTILQPHASSTIQQNSARSNAEVADKPKPRTYPVFAREIFSLRKTGSIKLPFVTREVIMDKGKSDHLARILFVSQTLWLVVQMIVRASRHLAVSRLEIGASAFLSCATIIYGLKWHKSKDVRVPLTLCFFAGAKPEGFAHIAGVNRSSKNQWIVTLLISSRKESERGLSIPNHYLAEAVVDEGDGNGIGTVESSRLVEICGFLLSSTIFGGIHFAAMNSVFPSHTDKILWLVASAICTGMGPFGFCALSCLNNLPHYFTPKVVCHYWHRKRFRVVEANDKSFAWDYCLCCVTIHSGSSCVDCGAFPQFVFPTLFSACKHLGL